MFKQSQPLEQENNLMACVSNPELLRMNKIKTEKNQKTCGVILTKVGYYTIPPIDCLYKYKNELGRCIIRGFTVGRVNYGKVFFPNEVDVTGLNLDDLVHFTYRTITIFPDDNNKHPLGTGLNQVAQVTLENVFPKKWSTGEDPSGSNLDDFLKNIYNLSEKLEAEFHGYIPETGSWIFNVSHFSKYAFVDEENTEQQQSEAEKKKLEEEEEHKKKLEEEEEHKKKLEEEEEHKKKLEEEEEHKKKLEEEEHKKKFQSIKNFDQNIHGCIHQVFSLLSRTNRMVAATLTAIDYTLFHIKNTTEKKFSDKVKIHKTLTGRKRKHEKYVQDESKNQSSVKTSSDKPTEQSSQRYSIEGASTSVSSLPEKNTFNEKAQKYIAEKAVSKNIIENTNTADSEIDILCMRLEAHKLYKLHNLDFNYVPLNKSLLKCHNYYDMALFKNKSFKIGFTGSNNFFAASLNNSNNLVFKSPLSYYGLYEKNFNDVFNEIILLQHLNIIFANSNIAEDNNNIPFANISKGKSTLVGHWTIAQTYSKTKHGLYYRSIWDLLFVFWGSRNDSNKKERLSNWFELYVEEEARKHYISKMSTKNDICSNIFELLSGHQIENAANLARDKNMPQLSLLISSINSNKRTKAFMEKQVYLWFKAEADDTIDSSMKKIYALLAGVSNIPDLQVYVDLDWKRALAAYLWYKLPSHKPISYILQYYEKSIFDHSVQAPYFDSQKRPGKHYDILYNIMLLSINKTNSLENILITDSHTDNPMDCSLSWFLMITFEALKIGIIAEDSRNHMHLNFASQLESIGLYKWAIFVLTFIKDPIVRKGMIMGVLYRYISISGASDEIEHELVLEFKISPTWIHSIKADQCLAAELYWQALSHLKAAERYVECHEIAMQHLIPTLIADKKFKNIRYLLQPLVARASNIPNWKNEGGLILEFLDVQKSYSSVTEQVPTETYLEITEKMTSLTRKFSDFPITSPKMHVCINEIISECVDLLIKLLDHLPSESRYKTYIQYLYKLPLPDELRFKIVFGISTPIL